MKTVNVVTLKKFKYHKDLDFYELIDTEKFEVHISKDVYEVIMNRIRTIMPKDTSNLMKIEVNVFEKVVGSDMKYSVDNLESKHRKKMKPFHPKNGQKIHI